MAIKRTVASDAGAGADTNFERATGDDGTQNRALQCGLTANVTGWLSEIDTDSCATN